MPPPSAKPENAVPDAPLTAESNVDALTAAIAPALSDEVPMVQEGAAAAVTGNDSVTQLRPKPGPKGMGPGMRPGNGNQNPGSQNPGGPARPRPMGAGGQGPQGGQLNRAPQGGQGGPGPQGGQVNHAPQGGQVNRVPQGGQANFGPQGGPGPQGKPGMGGRPAMPLRQSQPPQGERISHDAVLHEATLADAPPMATQAAVRPMAEPAAQPAPRADLIPHPDSAPKAEVNLTDPAAFKAPDAPAEAPKRGPGQKPGPGQKLGVKREDPFAIYTPAPTAKPARMRQRHWGLVVFFCLMVLLPAALAGWYMYSRAADQYESDIGFGSRTENAASTFSFLGLGSLGGLGGSSGGDMDILYQFISSQELVARIDKKLDLRAIYSKATNDPYFRFPSNGKIEDLVSYWSKMVVPSYDTSTGLMTVRVFAFDPLDAQKIASAVLDESTSIINELSVTSQEDATRYGKEALDKAQSEMAAAQKDLTTFRIKNNIVDPTDQLQGAGLVVTSLITQLGAAEIDRDMLVGTVPDNDPRVAQLTRRIDVIQKRIGE